MIKVAITDDHPLILNGIKEILEGISEVEIVGQWLDAASSRAGLKETIVDVMLLDINLPDGDGVELCKEFTSTYSQLKVVALTTYNQSLVVRNMLANGASGYLLKTATAAEIEAAIQAVMEGKTYLQPGIREILEAGNDTTKPTIGMAPKLTRREKQVLELVCKEHTTSEIAEMLFISQKTAETHRQHLIQKMGVRNTAGLVKEAIRQGLLE
jgi:DNA-binding NarL/FixJ family response regulator